MARQALRQFSAELAVLFLAGAAATAAFGYWLYPQFGIPYPAPMPGRTVVLVLLVWAIIRWRGETVRKFGLGRPDRIWIMILLALAFMLAKLIVVQPLADVVTGALALPRADHHFLDHVQGNLPALLTWLGIAWLIGGFAEEFIFRGYLMKRAADALGGTAWSWTIALMAQAALFGAGHLYLGSAGVVSATFTAFFFGLFFLLAGRNLWPVIIVHGAWDSLVLTMFYFRGVPST